MTVRSRHLRLRPDRHNPRVPGGLSRSGGGRGVAMEDLSLRAAGFGGPVGVQEDLPSPAVNTYVVVKLTQ